LYQYLTDEDKEKICSYIRVYGGHDSYLDVQQRDLEHILRFWDENKSVYEKIFANPELRVSRNVSFQKDSQYAIIELQYLLDRSRFISNIWNFTYSYNNDYTSEEKTNIRRAFGELTSENNLKNNEYGGETITFDLKDGKKYVLQKGCKAIKALRRLAHIYGIDGFDKFQTEYSQIFNEKNLSGTLSISIHPLDFITMSDNACGWESCMAWMTEGDYRMGTVEMMNSPCIVVAYLESKKPMSWSDNYVPYEWNNKKWRELFIFSKDCIVPIKGYPYHNEAIESTVLYWLKDLAAELGWKYKDNLFSFYGEAAYNLTVETNKGEEETVPYPVKFNCNTMYNDLANKDKNYIFVGEHRQRDHTLYLNFSGPAECMACGQEVRNTDEPQMVLCADCSGYVRCADCGEYIWIDDAYWIDGKPYCYACYENDTLATAIYGDTIPEHHAYPVYVKMTGYILQSTLLTLYLSRCEYDMLCNKGLIHYDEAVNFWKAYGSGEIVYDRGEVIYLNSLDKVLDEDTWIAYINAVRDIKWAIERYSIYHDEMAVEKQDGTKEIVDFDKDELLDTLEEIVGSSVLND